MPKINSENKEKQSPYADYKPIEVRPNDPRSLNERFGKYFAHSSARDLFYELSLGWPERLPDHRQLIREIASTSEKRIRLADMFGRYDMAERQDHSGLAKMKLGLFKQHDLKDLEGIEHLAGLLNYVKFLFAVPRVIQNLDIEVPEDDSKIRCVTYNIEGVERERDGDGVEEKINRVIRAFQTNDVLKEAGIICLNECDYHSTDVARKIAKELGMHAIIAPYFLKLDDESDPTKGPSDSALHGNAILTKYSINRVVTVPIGGANRFQRKHKCLGLHSAATFAELQISKGKTATVISVHLDNISTPEERKEWMEEVIRQRVELGFPEPVILTGDWNITTIKQRKITEYIEGLVDSLLTPKLSYRFQQPDTQSKYEPLFGLLEDAGYQHGFDSSKLRVTNRTENNAEKYLSSLHNRHLIAAASAIFEVIVYTTTKIKKVLPEFNIDFIYATGVKNIVEIELECAELDNALNERTLKYRDPNRPSDHFPVVGDLFLH